MAGVQAEGKLRQRTWRLDGSGEPRCQRGQSVMDQDRPKASTSQIFNFLSQPRGECKTWSRDCSASGRENVFINVIHMWLGWLSLRPASQIASTRWSCNGGGLVAITKFFNVAQLLGVHGKSQVAD
eukprot:5379946-Amphidinium_carterae.1